MPLCDSAGNTARQGGKSDYEWGLSENDCVETVWSRGGAESSGERASVSAIGVLTMNRREGRRVRKKVTEKGGEHGRSTLSTKTLPNET